MKFRSKSKTGDIDHQEAVRAVLEGRHPAMDPKEADIAAQNLKGPGHMDWTEFCAVYTFTPAGTHLRFSIITAPGLDEAKDEAARRYGTHLCDVCSTADFIKKYVLTCGYVPQENLRYRGGEA